MWLNFSFLILNKEGFYNYNKFKAFNLPKPHSCACCVSFGAVLLKPFCCILVSKKFDWRLFWSHWCHWRTRVQTVQFSGCIDRTCVAISCSSDQIWQFCFLTNPLNKKWASLLNTIFWSKGAKHIFARVRVFVIKFINLQALFTRTYFHGEVVDLTDLIWQKSRSTRQMSEIKARKTKQKKFFY